MLGFSKKKSELTPNESASAALRIVAIPEIFYGGADPVIHYASQPSRLVSEKPSSPRPQPQSAAAKTELAPPIFRNRTALIVVAVIFLLLFIGGTAWYYIQKQISGARQPTSPAAPSTNVLVPETPTTTEETPAVATPSTTPSTTAEIPVSLRDHLGEFPRLNEVDTVDADADELTDLEEASLGTDPGKWDTDADGYYDGQEVINLYNPNGFAPIKIIDSGLVSEYVNPSWQYRVYYPHDWVPADVDATGDQVIFSTTNGDFVEVHAFHREAGQTFDQWFAATVANQSFTDLIPVTNRFGIAGWKRKDGLVGYFPTDTAVFVLLYHQAEDGPVAYRHMIGMMMQSFRTGTIVQALPPQIPLPGTEASSTPGGTGSSTP